MTLISQKAVEDDVAREIKEKVNIYRKHPSFKGSSLMEQSIVKIGERICQSERKVDTIASSDIGDQ